MKGKGDNGGRLYEFPDKAVEFLHRFMASNNLRNTDLVRRFDIMPATVCKLLSTTRHPKRVQDGTYQILMQFCPALEPLMPQVKRMYIDRHRDRAGRPSNAEVLLRARLEKISADKLLQEVMLAVTDLEADEPGLDQETLRRVRAAISAVRRKYSGEEPPSNKDAEASK
jgi:hypothetical protein